MHRWDNSLWKFEYLKYTDFIWFLMTSKKNNNQNRLRASEFLRLLRLTGLQDVYINATYNDEDVEKFKNFKVAKRFEKFSPTDLATSQIQILSKRL